VQIIGGDARLRTGERTCVDARISQTVRNDDR